MDNPNYQNWYENLLPEDFEEKSIKHIDCASCDCNKCLQLSEEEIEELEKQYKEDENE